MGDTEETKPEVASQPDTTSPASSSTSLRVVASDDLPANPQRIVSLAPNITEILFELDAGKRVVAVTRYDDFPPEVKSLPKIGGIIDVDLEAVLTQQPDLVVGTNAGTNDELIAKLKKSDIPYLFVQMNTLKEIYAGIQKFGDAIGRGDRASEVRTEMKSKIDAISHSTRENSARQNSRHAQRPSVLMVFGHDPLVAAGPGSFGHEMLELAGGQNVLEDAKSPYPNVDIEKILSLNPDRIIDATITYNTSTTDDDETAVQPSQDRNFWAKYDSLSAVKNKHVFYFENPVLLRPAPRLVEGLKIMHRAINTDTPQDAADEPPTSD